MKFSSLRSLLDSDEYIFLDKYPYHGGYAWEFSTRNLCNSAIRNYKRYGFKLHCCFNPVRNSYCPVRDIDFQYFKSCAKFINSHFNYFERIGIL